MAILALRASTSSLRLLPTIKVITLSNAPAIPIFAPRRSVLVETLESLRQLLPPWLLAVPKKKTSHSKKAMRSANKYLKEQTAIVNCPSCGNAKRAHHVCPSCLSDFRREIHQEAANEKAASSLPATS